MDGDCPHLAPPASGQVGGVAPRRIGAIVGPDT